MIDNIPWKGDLARGSYIYTPRQGSFPCIPNGAVRLLLDGDGSLVAKTTITIISILLLTRLYSRLLFAIALT